MTIVATGAELGEARRVIDGVMVESKRSSDSGRGRAYTCGGDTAVTSIFFLCGPLGMSPS